MVGFGDRKMRSEEREMSTILERRDARENGIGKRSGGDEGRVWKGVKREMGKKDEDGEFLY